MTFYGSTSYRLQKLSQPNLIQEHLLLFLGKICHVVTWIGVDPFSTFPPLDILCDMLCDFYWGDLSKHLSMPRQDISETKGTIQILALNSVFLFHV